MTDSNRLQLAYVEEVTPGTTPVSPAMTKIRVKGESLNKNIQTTRSEEIRNDRLTPDLIQTMEKADGGFPMELSYGAFDDFIKAAMFNAWVNTPVKLNVTSDSSITAVTDSSDTFTVDAGGTSFKAGHLIRTSGFTNAANNGLFRVGSSTGTTVVVGGTPTLTDESAPPAGARIKVVGFRGASGDITATASGLGSTALDFTTLGLAVGQWVKIGGSSAGEKFATAALNDWARITAIAATALTLDNKPSGWTTDSGTSKTITVYFGDYLRVGTTLTAFSIEKVLLGQGVPAYIVYRGMTPNTFSLSFKAGSVASGAFDFLGYGASISTSPLDASPDEAPAYDVMNAVSDLGRIAEAGSAVASPNYIMSLDMTINNNLRERTAIGVMGLVGIGVGDADISGKISTYFGSKDLYEKFINNTASSINFRVNKDGRADVFTFPRVKFMDGKVNASARNQDVMAELGFQALRDPTTATSFQIDRLEEYA